MQNPPGQKDPAKSRSGLKTGERRSDDAFRRIVGMIFQGQISPGSKLPPERELSVSLGVSRTTLRDALNRLEARGVIDRRPKSGNFVRTVIPTSVREPIEDVVEDRVVGLARIIEIRKVLEVWAAAKAAEAPTAESLAALEDCLDEMNACKSLRTTGQFDRYSRADLRFHQVIAEMTGNSIYIHLFDFLADLVSRSISLSKGIVPGDFGQKNLTKHRRILAAIRKRDANLAQDGLLEHFAFIEKHLAPTARK